MWKGTKGALIAKLINIHTHIHFWDSGSKGTVDKVIISLVPPSCTNLINPNSIAKEPPKVYKNNNIEALKRALLAPW